MFLECEPIGEETGHRAGRALLARMYEAYVGGPMPAIAVTERGKPYWTGSPWHFSISHTQRHVFCALSRKPIGIDAEEMDREVCPALADKILSPPERLQWDAAPDKNLALLTFWVLKEARVKCDGTGLLGFPNRTAFSLRDPRVWEWDGCLAAMIVEKG